MNNSIKRGSVYFVDAECNATHVNRGWRPVVVVSNDACNNYSPTIHVVPLTSVNKKYIPTHAEIYIKGIKNIALCECVFPVDRGIVENGRFVCNLYNDYINEIDQALKVQFGLSFN